MRGRSIIVILLFFALINGCVDPFEFKGVDSDQLVVIDGYITNAQKAHRFKISRTAGFSNSRNVVISGCQVVIRSDQGDIETLAELAEGVYYTSPDFRAEFGKKYQLEVRTPDDQVIVSNEVALNSGNVMRDFEFEGVLRKTVRFSDGEVIDRETIDFSVTIDRSGEEAFYKWNMFPYFSYRANFVRPTGNEWCWIKDYQSDGVAIWHDDPAVGGASEKRILVATERYNFKLEHEYRVMLEQLTMDADAFKFWDAIRQQGENTGSVFDPLPISPKGNLSNSTDPETAVLGYFGAYKVDSLSLKLNYEEIEIFEDLPEYNCDPDPRGRRPPGCRDCLNLAWGQGKVTSEPSWW